MSLLKLKHVDQNQMHEILVVCSRLHKHRLDGSKNTEKERKEKKKLLISWSNNWIKFHWIISLSLPDWFVESQISVMDDHYRWMFTVGL